MFREIFTSPNNKLSINQITIGGRKDKCGEGDDKERDLTDCKVLHREHSTATTNSSICQQGVVTGLATKTQAKHNALNQYLKRTENSFDRNYAEWHDQWHFCLYPWHGWSRSSSLSAPHTNMCFSVNCVANLLYKRCMSSHWHLCLQHHINPVLMFSNSFLSNTDKKV